MLLLCNLGLIGYTSRERADITEQIVLHNSMKMKLILVTCFVLLSWCPILESNLSRGSIIAIVYGAMSKKWPLRIFLLYFNFFGYFASSNPPLPESSCRHFLPLHVWLPFRIQNGRFIQGSKNELTPIKLKSILSCSSDHKDSKNIWFAICPMFGNGVMGQVSFIC